MSLRIVTDDQQIKGRTYYSTLPDENIQSSVDDTVINVNNINLLVFKNTIPVTLVNILGGVDGQVLNIIGDGKTTLKNNAIIVTLSGSDTLLGIHKYSLVFYAGIWYQ